MSKLAVVTGGSRGIGRSTALALANHGHDVVITYREDAAAARSVVAEIEKVGRHAQAIQLDVGLIEAFDAFAAEIPSVDVLVHNAGTGGFVPFGEITQVQFDELLAVHFKGPLFLTQALLPKLVRGSTIIQISSGLTRYTYPGNLAYSAMKGGFEVAMRYLARELGPRGITANIVAPGGVITDFGGGVMRDPALGEYVAANTALGRVAQPDDIAAVVASLVEMSWATGQRIEATGGYSL